jgi:hypothetical protein
VSRRRLGAGAALLAAGAVAAVVVGTTGAADDADPQRQADGVATVKRSTLVESATLTGTLGYGDARTVVGRRSGTITWLAPAGSVVRTGETLYKVDGEPIVLFDGEVPAYRELRSGVSDGADVLQLERSLRKLGHTSDGMDVDREWDGDTTEAVRRWQDERGFSENGVVELGDVVFLPGARRISGHEAEVGSTGNGGAGGAAQVGTLTTGLGMATVFRAATTLVGGAWDVTLGGAPAGAAVTTPTRTTPTTAPEGQTTPSTTTPTTTTPTTTTTTPKPTTAPTTTTTPSTAPPTTPAPPTTTRAAPRSGGAGALAGAAASAGPSAAGGGAATAAATSDAGTVAVDVLRTTSTRRLVRVDVPVADQSLAAVGRSVEVELPDGSFVPGRIARVGSVATEPDPQDQADGGGGETTIEMTVRLTERAGGGLDDAPVSVSLARETRRDVLVVPVTALVARTGGGYAVERVRGGAVRELVRVEIGLVADGEVEIVRGVREGDRVGVPQ